MKTDNSFKLGLSLIIIMLSLSNISKAQNLSKLQKNSYYAPKTINVDGKEIEWNDQYQTYNKATDVFYTIANDENNIYLIVKAEKPRVIVKILGVGIVFTIYDKDNKNNTAITFPLLDVPTGSKIMFRSGASKVAINPTMQQLNGVEDKSKQLETIDTSLKQANEILSTNAKLIKINGIPEIGDTLSVYNEQHIKVAAQFDSKRNYIYELAIPIKYLKLTNNSLQKFNYNIRIPSRFEDLKKGTIVLYTFSNGSKIDSNQDLDTSTDFSGEYTLAKKP